MQYSSGLKARMIQRMSGRDSLSANKLSEEVGISQNTPSRWLREAPEEKKVKRNGHLAERSPMRPEAVPPAEKLRLVMEASTLSENELGEFLRRNGLHEAQLEAWRKKVEEAAVGALGKPKKGRHRKSPDAKKVQLLQRELLRKHRALAEGPPSWRSKKTGCAFGGRGRKHHAEAAKLLELDERTVQRWSAEGGGDDRRQGPTTEPRNKLTAPGAQAGPKCRQFAGVSRFAAEADRATAREPW